MIPLVAPDFKLWMPHAIHPLIDSGILLATISAVALTEEELRRAAEAIEH